MSQKAQACVDALFVALKRSGYPGRHSNENVGYTVVVAK